MGDPAKPHEDRAQSPPPPPSEGTDCLVLTHWAQLPARECPFPVTWWGLHSSLGAPPGGK